MERIFRKSMWCATDHLEPSVMDCARYLNSPASGGAGYILRGITGRFRSKESGGSAFDGLLGLGRVFHPQ